MVNYLLCLVCEHLAGKPQVSLVFFGESRAGFQIFQIQHRDSRPGDFGRSVRVPRNMFETFFMECFAPLFAAQYPRSLINQSWVLMRTSTQGPAKEPVSFLPR